MKKFLILFVLVLLLAGGGFAAYVFLVPGGDEILASEPEPPPPPPEPMLVPIDPMTIPVIRQGTVRKYVLLKLTLQLTDQDSKERAMVAMPRIKDETFRNMHAYFAGVPVDAPVSLAAIKRRIRTVAEQSLGKDSIVDVLVEGVYEKRSGG